MVCLPSNAIAGLWQHTSSPATWSQPSLAQNNTASNQCNHQWDMHPAAVLHPMSTLQAANTEAMQHACAPTRHRSMRMHQPQTAACILAKGVSVLVLLQPLQRGRQPQHFDRTHRLCCKRMQKGAKPRHNPALQEGWPRQHMIQCHASCACDSHLPNTAADNCRPSHRLA
jgi:hypothetical protein